MRTKSMNVEELLLRGSKTFNPRRVQSTFVRTPSKPDDQEEFSDPTKLTPFPAVQETFTEHF